MVNAGAIATTSLVPGATHAAKWQFIHEGLSRFAGRELPMNEEVLESALETNFRNRSIAQFLQSAGAIYCEPMEAVDLYTRQCSLNVSARDLAVMGATLADGGANPLTRERVVDPMVCHYPGGDGHGWPVRDLGRLAFRHRAAGQERHWRRHCDHFSGQGRLGHVCAAARRSGNSVKGQLVAKFLSQRLGMDLFVSEPEQ